MAEDPGPDLDSIGGWTQDEAIAYEVAKETFNDLVGYCMARIYEQEAKPEPDQAVIDHWNSEADRYVRERRGLDASDGDAVQRVITEYGALARRLYGRGP
jgi:hypothetical protein